MAEDLEIIKEKSTALSQASMKIGEVGFSKDAMFRGHGGVVV